MPSLLFPLVTRSRSAQLSSSQLIELDPGEGVRIGALSSSLRDASHQLRRFTIGMSANNPHWIIGETLLTIKSWTPIRRNPLGSSTVVSRVERRFVEPHQARSRCRAGAELPTWSARTYSASGEHYQLARGNSEALCCLNLQVHQLVHVP